MLEFARIEMHSYSELGLEVGGFLLGTIQNGNTSVVASIPALKAKSQQISLTFTHEVWEEALKTAATEYPGLSIVGWYHTHPSFGLFLSEYDIFIQKNFFAAPGQIALVIDPIAGDFAWFSADGRSKEPKLVDRGSTKAGPRERTNTNLKTPAENVRMLLTVAAATVMSALVTWGLTTAFLPESSSARNWKDLAERQSQELQRVNQTFESQIFIYTLKKSEKVSEVMKRFYGSPEIPDTVSAANGWIEVQPPKLSEGDTIYLVSVPGLIFPGISQSELEKTVTPDEPAPTTSPTPKGPKSKEDDS